MPALERSKPPHVRATPLSVSPDGRSGPVLHRQHTAAQFESTRPTKHDRSTYRRLFHSSQYNTRVNMLYMVIRLRHTDQILRRMPAETSGRSRSAKVDTPKAAEKATAPSCLFHYHNSEYASPRDIQAPPGRPTSLTNRH